MAIFRGLLQEVAVQLLQLLLLPAAPAGAGKEERGQGRGDTGQAGKRGTGQLKVGSGSFF